MRVEAFCDGSCSGNPGLGGWGVLLRASGKTKTVVGGDLHATNNQMELMGAIIALETLTRPCEVVLTTDSEYVKKGMTEWMYGWKKKGRLDVNHPKAVANVELWMRLDQAAARHQVSWEWVRGHDGHPENELADRLAKSGVELMRTHGPEFRLIDGEVRPVGEGAASSTSSLSR